MSAEYVDVWIAWDTAIADTIAQGLAHHPAGTCDGCGEEAVELATWIEDDGANGCRLRYCVLCMGDDAGDPSLEWIVGEAIS